MVEDGMPASLVDGEQTSGAMLTADESARIAMRDAHQRHRTSCETQYCRTSYAPADGGEDVVQQSVRLRIAPEASAKAGGDDEAQLKEQLGPELPSWPLLVRLPPSNHLHFPP